MPRKGVHHHWLLILQLVKNRKEQPEAAAKENSEGHDHGLHFFVRQPTGGSTSSRNRMGWGVLSALLVSPVSR
jgi:hypothetical protein